MAWVDLTIFSFKNQSKKTNHELGKFHIFLKMSSVFFAVLAARWFRLFNIFLYNFSIRVTVSRILRVALKVKEIAIILVRLYFRDCFGYALGFFYSIQEYAI